MNREVENSGLQMTAEGQPFELEVPERTGAETSYNSRINDLGYLTGDNERSTSTGSIRWVMRDESYNTSAEDYIGIRPGSYGKFEFYLIPSTDENAEYIFSLKMTGYYAEFQADNNNPELFSNEIVANSFKSLAEKANGDNSSPYALAANYLKGHIMFFQNHKVLTETELNGTSDSNLYYSGRIADSFVYDTADHQADKTTWNGKNAYHIKIYWIWPNTFSQIVLDTNDSNLYGDALFSSKQSGTPTPRNNMISYIASNPGYYFGTSELASASSASLNTMMSATSLNTTNALITLSNGYNAADQIIGENAQFIFVEMVADQNNA